MKSYAGKIIIPLCIVLFCLFPLLFRLFWFAVEINFLSSLLPNSKFDGWGVQEVTNCIVAPVIFLFSAVAVGFCIRCLDVSKVYRWMLLLFCLFVQLFCTYLWGFVHYGVYK